MYPITIVGCEALNTDYVQFCYRQFRFQIFEIQILSNCAIKYQIAHLYINATSQRTAIGAQIVFVA